MKAKPMNHAVRHAVPALGLMIALHSGIAQSQSEHDGHRPHRPLSAPSYGATHDHAHMDHSDHARHGAHAPAQSAAPSGRRHGQGDPRHGSHSSHGLPHRPEAGSAATQTSPAPLPVISPADRDAAFPDLPEHHMHRGGTHVMFVADELEWQDADEGSTLAWDLSGWAGGDIDRLAWRAEGERTNGHTEEAELQLLWSHATSPWWETVAGIRQDFKPGPAQTWAAFGVQGMPLYGLETEATAFIGEGGQTALRLEAEYDILLTQRWILQPTGEINLHGRNDERRGVGSGLSEASAGLRLRYEISRQFAPYLGVTWSRAYGNNADLQRVKGEETSEARLVAGIRFWF